MSLPNDPRYQQIILHGPYYVELGPNPPRRTPAEQKARVCWRWFCRGIAILFTLCAAFRWWYLLPLMEDPLDILRTGDSSLFCLATAVGMAWLGSLEPPRWWTGLGKRMGGRK